MKIVSLFFFACSILSGYGLYTLIKFVVDGMLQQNLGLVIGGEILLVLFLGLLIVAIILFILLGLIFWDES